MICVIRGRIKGLRRISCISRIGFTTSLRKMHTFYEEWQILSDNSFVETNKFPRVPRIPREVLNIRVYSCDSW